MERIDRDNVYELALQKWGRDAQIIMAIEEMAELQHALCKFLNGKGDLNDIADELADVEIMMEQLRIVFANNGRTDVIKESKLKRLIDMLKKPIGTALLLLALFGGSPAQAAQRDYTKAVIHHTVSGCSTTREDIRRWHVDENGWDDIGYHYIIDCDGNLIPGRRMEHNGAHARTGKSKSRNHWTGIALIGKDSFTDAQIKTLKQLIKDFDFKVVERHHQNCPGPGVPEEVFKK